jgi:hypothetical protein
VPVAFGPRWRESRDAGLLLEAGAGTALDGPGEPGVASLLEVWEGWLTGDEQRRSQGARAKDIVTAGLGAARRSAQMLAEFISSRPPRT